MGSAYTMGPGGANGVNGPLFPCDDDDENEEAGEDGGDGSGTSRNAARMRWILPLIKPASQRGIE